MATRCCCPPESWSRKKSQMLEDQVHRALVGGPAHHVFFADFNGSGRGLGKPGDHPQKGGFTAS